MLIVSLPALFWPGWVGHQSGSPGRPAAAGKLRRFILCRRGSPSQGDLSHRHILRNGPPYYSRPCAFLP